MATLDLFSSPGWEQPTTQDDPWLQQTLNTTHTNDKTAMLFRGSKAFISGSPKKKKTSLVGKVDLVFESFCIINKSPPFPPPLFFFLFLFIHLTDSRRDHLFFSDCTSSIYLSATCIISFSTHSFSRSSKGVFQFRRGSERTAF